MKKNEAECCDVICIHNDRVEKVRENMPEDSLLIELADFYKVFGDATRIRILCDLASAESIKADEAGKEPKGRKDGILFSCGRTYPVDHQSGDGTYYRVTFI